MRLHFKIDTGADVIIITKKTWLAMKDKPRLEPTAVRLNSVGGQLKAFGQFMAVTKHRNTVYRFNVIVIEWVKITNLLSRDVAADLGLVCRLEQVDASGDDDARFGLMKTELVTIILKAWAEPMCLTTARRVPFPLMDAVKAKLKNMVESDVNRVVTLLELSRPNNVSELRTMLGMFQYLAKFMYDMSSLRKPMTELLNSDVVWSWEKAQQASFDKTKELLTTTPTLSYYDSTKPTVVSTDANSCGTVLC